MTVPEAQAVLGVSRQRVYQLINWGRLDGEKVGNTYRVKRDSVNLRLAAGSRLGSGQCISSVEVSDFFGVDVRTVRDWVSQGVLKARKINNRLCFAPGDVVTFNPPTYSSSQGRYPGRKPTRTLRGRYYPPPEGQPTPMRGTNAQD